MAPGSTRAVRMGTRRLNALTQDGKLCWGDVSQHVGDEDDHISEMSGEMGRQFQSTWFFT